MLINNFKANLFLSSWKKYLPVIKILIKKSWIEPQVFEMNRSDFEKDAKRKSGYKFDISFVRGRPDIVVAGNEIIGSFISALLSDKMINELLIKGDYTFALNNKYQLQIKNNALYQDVITEPVEEVLYSN